MSIFVRNRSVRPLVAGATLVTAALALTACGSGDVGDDSISDPSTPIVALSASEWDELVAQANEEGELNIYWSTGEKDATPELFADFAEEYPDINVNVTFLATGDLVGKVSEEMAAGVKGADIVNHASPQWFSDTSAAGEFASIKLNPENEEAGWEERADGNNYITWWGFQYLLGYNTDEPEPESLKQILDDNPDARIGLVDPHVAPSIAFVYEQLRHTYGDEILDQMAAAKFIPYGTNTQQSAGLAAGEIDYAYPDQVNTTGPNIKQGAPVALHVTNEAQAGAYYNFAIPKNTPHPAAAQVWANYILSETGQSAIVADNAPAGATPSGTPSEVVWDDVAFLDPNDWTNDKWNAWIEEYWTPRFG